MTPTFGRHPFGCHPNGSAPTGAIVNGSLKEDVKLSTPKSRERQYLLKTTIYCGIAAGKKSCIIIMHEEGNTTVEVIFTTNENAKLSTIF